MYDGEGFSAAARRNGVAPNLLYRWRNLMLEGGSIVVTGDDRVTSNKAVREMESRIQKLERQLGRNYVCENPVPDAETTLKLIGNWIEEYNENYPHSGLQ